MRAPGRDRSRSFAALGLTVLLGALGGLVACVSHSPVRDWQPDPPTKPIPIGPAGSEPLAFRKVVYRIPTNKVVGDVYIGSKHHDEMRWTVTRNQSNAFNVAVTDGLRNLGYHVRDEADSLFDQKGRTKVRYEMAAILHDATLDFYYRTGRSSEAGTPNVGQGTGLASVVVEVQLFDAIEKRTVYTRRFESRARDDGKKPSPLAEAIVTAILKATADPTFTAWVAIDENGETRRHAMPNPIEIKACGGSDSKSLPGDLPDILKSVVEIQSGSVGGTGVFISPDGWILTAAHVVVDAPEVWIRLDAGAQLPAEIIAADPESDLALLRVQGRNYACAPIGEASREVELGSDVFAINLAIGEDRNLTVTRGVVSGYPVQDGRRFLQTDASLNPGSSGGPLLSPDGSVAGITVRKVVGHGIEGLGLAVPAHQAARQLEIRLVE